MPNKLNIYPNLPYPLKVMAASMQGYYLRWWRYGQETEKMVGETLERETWTANKWKTWQEERLASILHRAANMVTHYQDQWQNRRKNGDRSSWELISNWPVLTKEELRKAPKSFLAEDCHPNRMYQEHTSGTTGKPVVQWFSRSTVQHWYAIYEARIRLWNGVSRHDRWGIIGGQMIAPVQQFTPPFWVWNQGLKQLYLSAYHISRDNVQAYLKAIQDFELAYLLGYPSALYTIANEGRALGIAAPNLKMIISNAEPLLLNQRQLIQDYFRCPVRNTYGMTENVTAASECSKGNMHLFPEVGVLEIMDFNEDIPLAPGKFGRMICTGLINPDMPLIRYDVGDAGSQNLNEGFCECGRQMPLLNEIEGRTDDMIITPDGKHIGRMDPVFKTDLKIKEAQIIQEALDLIKIKVVPADGFGDADIQDIIQRVQQRLGDSVSMAVEQVAKIPRTKAGKFKAVVSRLNK